MKKYMNKRVKNADGMTIRLWFETIFFFGFPSHFLDRLIESAPSL